MVQIEDYVDIVRQAGTLAMSIYERPYKIAAKNDKSPITEADLAVDDLLVSFIRKHAPDVEIVTEERSINHAGTGLPDVFFLIDPIDGTKEFIKKTGEFTINIGLIDHGEPVAGIVYAPALERMFVGQRGKFAYEIGADGTRKDLAVRACGDEVMAVASRSHLTSETEKFLADNKIEHCVNAGSSLKFCCVAAGEADIYPRYGPTMEWDTAAAHAILAAAGGRVRTLDGAELAYGKPEFKNPYFIACSGAVEYSLE